VTCWPSCRYKILLGVGDALLYLHKECGTVVVHGNIKPSNVMLESFFNARLGDFGLAGIYDSPYPVGSGMGITMGYTPLEEVMCTNRFTTETDTSTALGSSSSSSPAVGRQSFAGSTKTGLISCTGFGSCTREARSLTQWIYGSMASSTQTRWSAR